MRRPIKIYTKRVEKYKLSNNLPEPKESLGPENHMLLRRYERADGRDKKIIWSILERYMTEAEKESSFSSGLDKKNCMKVYK